MPNNFTTLQLSWDTLTLSTLKKTGADEYHGPCPVTGEGKDRFWVKPDDRRIGCRGCGYDGNGKLDDTAIQGASRGAGARTFRGAQTCSSRTTGQNYLDRGDGHLKRAPGGEQKYRWPKGTKTDDARLPGKRHDREADAAARVL